MEEPSAEKIGAKVPLPKRVWGWCKKHKRVSIPLAIVMLIVIVLAVPASRYLVLGMFIKKDITVSILDKTTGKPVSAVTVRFENQTVATNNKGAATLRSVKPGPARLTLEKKYYASSQALPVSITIFGNQSLRFKLAATGRQVPITVTNKISGKPVANATIKAKGSSAKTNQSGQVTIVLPAGQKTIIGTLAAEGYLTQSATVTVSQSVVKENSFSLTPTGTLYFLSKASGTIDVIKTNLDGSNRRTVLAGTGKEEEQATILLAARDWRYLAFKSRRDNDKAKLYLIDTATDKLSELDSGDASFNLIGWSDHRFIYETVRDNVQYWQPKQTALKGFDAATGNLSILDETKAEGNGPSDYASESIHKEYILNNLIVYIKQWSGYPSSHLGGKKNGIYAIKPDASGRQLLKEFDALVSDRYSSIDAKLYKPQEVYFAVSDGEGPSDTTIYELENGKIAAAPDTDFTTFAQKVYPTFILAPSGKQTFWAEERDGKNSLFFGNQSGGDTKQFASLSELTPYGWYSDEYIVLSKNASELYIASSSASQANFKPLKVTDYHKPKVDFTGYGGGYGGF